MNERENFILIEKWGVSVCVHVCVYAKYIYEHNRSAHVCTVYTCISKILGKYVQRC